MNFKDKKVLVIGMARSGIAAAQVLAKRGAWVTACDIKTPDMIQDTIDQLMGSKIQIWAGSYPEVKKENYDMVLVSPGVPLDIEPVQEARNLNLPVIGEVELAYLLKSPKLQMYGITGTNGKTTTTALLQAILDKNGQKSAAGGNIGIPLTILVDSMDEGIITVEVSSFQLETINVFKPHLCGILNITPDHLDRHKTMEAYIKAKANIFANQNADDFTILNYEDEILRDFSLHTRAKVIYFSTDRVLDEGVFVKEGLITGKFNNKVIDICKVNEVTLKGKHNLENILCATAMALAANVKPENIASVLKSFKGVRHRMEEVLTHNGVTYINDSKATNPESAIKALESFNQPIILIAGGRNKGSKFDKFAKVVIKNTQALILLGEAKEEIKSAVMAENYTNIYEVDNINEAVKLASEMAGPGNIVLLSPACASWDMFESYEQRGDIFCELVHLIGEA